MVGKAQIVEGIAARGASRAAATAALDAVLAEITDALAGGERVTLTGFGTFEAVARSERTARNPRTGSTVTVAATTVARFHPGAALREAVASGGGHDGRPPIDLSGLDTTVTGNVKKYRATPPPAEAPGPAAAGAAAAAVTADGAADGATSGRRGKAKDAKRAKAKELTKASAAGLDGKRVKVGGHSKPKKDKGKGKPKDKGKGHGGSKGEKAKAKGKKKK